MTGAVRLDELLEEELNVREIKFRAWNPEEKTMNECVSVGCSRKDRWPTLVVKNGLIDSPLGKPILLQYTGLKDRNGREIYEGDILKLVLIDYANEPEDIFVVQSESFYCDVCYLQSIVEFIELSGSEIDSIEVIGNIYENPELLKRVNENESSTAL